MVASRDPGEILAHLVRAQDRPSERIGDAGRERRLAGAGFTADDREGDAGLAEVRHGQAEEPAGFGSRRRVALQRAEPRDLGPNVGSHGQVVVQERRRVGVADQLLMVGQQPAGELVGPEALEIHREEGDVGENVSVAELVVELEAVEHARAVVEQEDVVGEEISVPVADATVLDPEIEQSGAAIDVSLGPGLDLGLYRAIRLGRQQWSHLGEAVAPPSSDGRSEARPVDLGRGLRPPVERGDDMREVAHRPIGDLARLDQPREPPAVGHPAHHDEVVRRLAVGCDEVEHAEVHVGRDPPVQLHLPVTDALPGLARGEIDEREAHGLLQLRGVFPDQEDDRDVGREHRGGLRACSVVHEASIGRRTSLGRGNRRTPGAKVIEAPSARTARPGTVGRACPSGSEDRGATLRGDCKRHVGNGR